MFILSQNQWPNDLTKKIARLSFYFVCLFNFEILEIEIFKISTSPSIYLSNGYLIVEEIGQSDLSNAFNSICENSGTIDTNFVIPRSTGQLQCLNFKCPSYKLVRLNIVCLEIWISAFYANVMEFRQVTDMTLYLNKQVISQLHKNHTFLISLNLGIWSIRNILALH